MGQRDRMFKVLVVGDATVGKTSLVQRYANDSFNRHYKSTVGVDFALKVVQWSESETVRLQLWDIAGRAEVMGKQAAPASPQQQNSEDSPEKAFKVRKAERPHRSRPEQKGTVTATVPTASPSTPVEDARGNSQSSDPDGFRAKHLFEQLRGCMGTHGQERFTSMTRLYYRDASACVIMFDVTNVSTFSNSQKWKQDLDSKLVLPDGSPVPCLLLANKCDLSPWAVTRDEVDRFSKENGFSGWVETSVKENKNINESMRVLIEKMMSSSTGDGSSSAAGSGDYINIKETTPPGWACC